jgi:Zn-dependent peptidase ImmA (M78 family)/transcriptional regulator with XRE-family HTH domain
MRDSASHAVGLLRASGAAAPNVLRVVLTRLARFVTAWDARANRLEKRDGLPIASAQGVPGHPGSARIAASCAATATLSHDLLSRFAHWGCHYLPGCAKITHMDMAQGWDEVGERIAEARLAAGMNQGKLAFRVGLDRTALVRIEAGERRISALELSRLADALGVPMAHLLSRSPAPLVSRRSALEEGSDESSRARYRLDARLEEHARHAQWLISEGFLVPPALDPAVQRPGQAIDPIELASAARKAVGVPSGPLGPLADVVEQLGLFLTVVEESAEGASLLLDGYGVAVISGEAAPGRRRWTAAHELGHHLLQDEYHSDAGVAAGRDEREQLIDRFAENFLLPANDVRDIWHVAAENSSHRSILIDLSATYRVSWSAVINRARNLELIDKTEARHQKANIPGRGDFLAVRGEQPIPDLEYGVTGKAWRKAVLNAWENGAITAPRTVALLYGALTEDDLPTRNLEDCLP